jgi:prepilin-type processing-associated H-X9-DG protein
MPRGVVDRRFVHQLSLPQPPEFGGPVERRSLHKVFHSDDIIAFFDFSLEPSEWWSGRAGVAGYISGIVVARASRGRGVGTFIPDYAEEKARDGGANYLRLDCHAENRWLCEYYRTKGFIELTRIEQHPGYIGALYEKRIGVKDDDI